MYNVLYNVTVRLDIGGRNQLVRRVKSLRLSDGGAFSLGTGSATAVCVLHCQQGASGFSVSVEARCQAVTGVVDSEVVNLEAGEIMSLGLRAIVEILC